MLKVSELGKRYTTEAGNVHAVQGISFDVKEAEFFTLLGPSGCGKTTTLRCIAGLERPDTGEITVDEERVFSGADGTYLPASSRDIGMVFQSYAIWPHMSVFDNVAFPLVSGRTHCSKAEVRERVMGSLALVDLEDLAERPAPFLSGGQQQRVALARALVHEPKMLLLDEPLSNLDAKLREDMRIVLKTLVKRLKMTTLYVTHDQVEALSMSDRIAVMYNGKIMQEDVPRIIYTAPRDAFTASFIGKANFFQGRLVTKMENGLPGIVETAVGELLCFPPSDLTVGDEVLVSVRPEAVKVSSAPPIESSNVLKGKIEFMTFVGDALEGQVIVGEQQVRIKVTPFITLDQVGEVYLQLPPERCFVIRNPGYETIPAK